MFVPMIANCAQVIICAFSTFPSDTNDGLLSTSITHSPIMLDTYEEKKKNKTDNFATAPHRSLLRTITI